MREKGLGKVEHAAQTDIEDRVIVLGLNIKQANRLRDPGVIDENIDGSKILDDLLCHSLTGVFPGHIANVSAVLLAQRSGLFLRRVSFEIQHCYGCAMFREHTRGGVTNTVFSGCAGNDGEFIFQ